MATGVNTDAVNHNLNVYNGVWVEMAHATKAVQPFFFNHSSSSITTATITLPNVVLETKTAAACPQISHIVTVFSKHTRRVNINTPSEPWTT